MSVQDKTKEKRTSILGFNKTPSSTNIWDILKELSSFKDDIILIKKFSPKKFDTMNFLIQFKNADACEKAKNSVSITIKDEKFYPYFAPSNALKEAKSVVSENKLYVSYPAGVDHDDLLKKFEGLKIYEPADKRNFLFVVCENQKEQIQLKDKYDGLEISGKPISVTFAINKVQNRPNRKYTRKTSE